MKTLIIDPNLTRRDRVEQAFATRGHRCAVASDMDQAMVALSQECFEVIVAGVCVSEILDLCTSVRSDSRQHAAFILAAVAAQESELTEHLLMAGVDDFFIQDVDEPLLPFRCLVAEQSLNRRKNAASQPEFTAGVSEPIELFFQHSSELFLLLRLDAVIDFVGPAIPRLLGYPETFLEGQPFSTFVHPEDQQNWQLSFAQILDSPGKSADQEFRFLAKDGKWLWLAGRVTHPLGEKSSPKFAAHYRIITQQKEALLASEASDGRFRRLFEMSPLGIVLSRNRSVLYVNDAYSKMFGYAAGEIAHGELLNLIAPHCRQEIADRIERRSRGEPVPVSYETTGLRKDGSEFPFHILVEKIDLADGPASVAYIRDTAERAQANEMLRLLESAVQQANDSIIITSAEVDWAEARILFVNHAFVAMTGYAPTEIIGKTPGILYGPKTQSEVMQRLRAALDRGQPFQGEITHYRKDGTELLVHCWVSPIRNAQGTITHFVSTQSDITETKRAEVENQKLAAFARLNPNPVLELSAEGKLTYFNEATLEMAKSLNHADPRLILPADTAAIVRKCLTSGRSKMRHETIIGGRTLSWSFFPIVASEVVHCYAGDITERLSLEAQLRQSQKMESVGQLAAGVAHDFNNILTVIQGFTGLLLSDPNKDPKMVEALNQISTAADRAANLTRQLLTFSRKQVLQARVLDLNEVINNVTKMLRRLVGEDIALQCLYASNLPLIYADAGMLEQIIMNLAVNARDAMPKGGMLTITTSLISVEEDYRRRNSEARLGEFVCLTVSDTGYGMDDATLNRIFEPFFTTKEVGKGTGLGLATVYGIVKQHDGWIEVGSRPGEGTTFNVVLPINKKTGDTVFVQKKTSQLCGGTETIMVVEDEPALRGLAFEILRRYGYKVVDAGSGSEALQVWAQNDGRIDLVLTDMVMPGGMSGAELGEKLRALKPALKVIYTSGYSVDIMNQEMNLKENFNFLQKPYGPSSLLGLVRKVLDNQTSIVIDSLPAVGSHPG